MTNCNGRIVLVTGGSRGIGRAAALAEAGACVLVHYGRSAAEADEVVAFIRATGGKAQAIGADLATPDGPAALAKKVHAIAGERLDILVANAGVAKFATIEDTTIEDFNTLFAVNVRAPFFLVQQLLPILREGSSVIFTSSLAAHANVGTLSAYAATKGAIDTLVKHFAVQLGPKGIRVNAIAPGGCGHRNVELRQDRGGSRLHLGHAGAETRCRAGGHCRRHRLPRVRRGALGERRYAARRWRLEALKPPTPYPV